MLSKETIFGLVKPRVVTHVGLDIGSYSVKCVEISQENQKIELKSAQVLRLASASAENQLNALRSVYRSVVTAPKQARISVSGPSVLIRNVTFPRMTAQELKGAIRFEAERYIPFPIDDCILDFQILSPSSQKTAMRVLLVAAKKDFVEQRLKMLSQLGLEAEIIDADILCFANAFEKLGDDANVKTYGLLNIGHSLSSFAIVHNAELFFVREMLFGGFGVTKAVVESKAIPDEAADEWKKKRDPALAEEQHAATRKGFDPLVDELRRSIDYFENEAGEDLKIIYAAGGGIRSEGAAEILSEELGKQVVMWSPGKKLEIGAGVDRKFVEEHLPELNVAYGLAIRGIR